MRPSVDFFIGLSTDWTAITKCQLFEPQEKQIMAQTQAISGLGIDTGFAAGHLSLHEYRKYLSQEDDIKMPLSPPSRTLKRKQAAVNLLRIKTQTQTQTQTQYQYHDFGFHLRSPVSSAPSSPPPLSSSQSVISLHGDIPTPISPGSTTRLFSSTQPTLMQQLVGQSHCWYYFTQSPNISLFVDFSLLPLHTPVQIASAVNTLQSTLRQSTYPVSFGNNKADYLPGHFLHSTEEEKASLLHPQSKFFSTNNTLLPWRRPDAYNQPQRHRIRNSEPERLAFPLQERVTIST